MRSLTLLLLGLCVGARAAEPALVFQGRVDCRSSAKPAGPAVPKNAVLIAFNEGAFSSAEKWIAPNEDGIVRAVNQLLEFYGFEQMRAQKIPFDEATAMTHAPQADVNIDYLSNSAVVFVGNACAGSGGATTPHPLCWDGPCDYGGDVFGPNLRHPEAEDICVGSFSRLGGPQSFDPVEEKRTPRLRAYMAALIVHEFIHAMHARVLGDLVASRPASPPKSCPLRIPLQNAIDASKKFREELAIPSGAMHMSSGLMTAGLGLAGDPSANANIGPFLNDCLYDSALPSSLFSDLRVLAASNAACLDGKVAVSRFFALPEKNKAWIRRHIADRAAVGCHSACYYEVVK